MKMYEKENTKFMDYIVASSPIAAIVINFYIYEYWISMISDNKIITILCSIVITLAI